MTRGEIEILAAVERGEDRQSHSLSDTKYKSPNILAAGSPIPTRY